MGVKFIDITKFEQSLVSKIISHKLAAEGLPLHIDPFTEPPPVEGMQQQPITGAGDDRLSREEMLEKIMSGD